MARTIVHGISWLGEEGMLHTASVTGPDALASVLHELLALPGQQNWSTLERFAVQAEPQPETHFVYLIAGAVRNPSDDADAERLLSSVMDLGICRRMTLMPERCSREAATDLRSLGCEVQLMNGRIPDMEAEVEL